MTEKTGEDEIPKMFARAAELRAAGMASIEASQLADLERRIANWPKGHGDHLEILIFGELQPPQADFEVPELGIIVFKEPLTNTFIKALYVVKATVTVSAKTVDGLQDAIRRINLLLGINSLVNWGNSAVGWWSWVTHGTGAAISPHIDHKETLPAVQAVLTMAPHVRRKVDAALFWIREPRSLMTDAPRVEVLRMFSAYWNAFECLVDAIEILRPRRKLSRTQKQAEIDALIARRGGRLTPEDVQACYHDIINPRFKAKAQHAMTLCFGEAQSTEYMKECFALPDKGRTLYQIRNSIDHGDIDATDAKVLHMVEDRLRDLWMIVWRMFGRLIPFAAPLDSRFLPPKISAS